MPIVNDDRKQILSRIRKALKTPAPRHGAHREEKAEPAFENQLPIVNNAPTRQWLPPVGETWDEQIQLFANNAADLKAEFFLCGSKEEALGKLKELAQESGWKKLGAHGHELVSEAVEALQLPCMLTDGGYEIDELEACDAGITVCEALVAQTGSVLVTNRSCGGRALSVLPPHHIVLARKDQLVPDLTAALRLLQSKYSDSYPTVMSFITGPSRTGDIERILVLGAHGPKRLTIYCF